MAYKINPITGKMDLVGGNSNSESDSGLSSKEVQELIKENLDNPENLVTEDENGIARAIDKKVTDKSMINSVILSAQFASAAEASKRLTEVSDGFYSPVHAQTMHWLDLNGNLHLSRYSEALGISGLDRKPLCWLGGAVNENKVVVLNGVNKNNSDVGGMAYAISTDGIHWKYGVATETVERWLPIQYGDGLFIANSGNSSQEYIVGTLQGPNQDSIQWSVFSNMPSGYHSVMQYCDGVWVVCGNQGGVAYSYDIYIYDPYEGTFNLLLNVNRGDVRTNVAGITLKVWDGKLYITDNYGLDIINLETMSLMATYSISGYAWYDIIKFEDSIYLYGRRQNGFVYLVTDSGLKQMVGGFPRSTNIVEHNGYLFWLGNFGDDGTTNIAYTNYFSIETTGQTMGAKIDTTCPIQLLPYGDDILVISGTVMYNTVANSDFVYSLKANTLRSARPTINNVNRWEEVPVLPTGNDSLIMRHDNDFKTVRLEQLILNDDTLKVDSSDEYLAPVGYKCLPLDPSEPTLYCPVPLADVTTDGNTELFEDPQCLYYYGSITNKSFNPNNPTEIEVTVWREGSEVQLYYLITDTLYPDTIATTKAVMQLSKKLNIADYAYPVFLGIVGYEDQKLYELCSKKSFELQSGTHAEGLLDLEKMDLNILPNFEINESYPYYDFEILNFSGTYEDENGAIRQICEERETDGTFVSMKAEGNKLYLSYNKNDVSHTNVFFQVRFMIMPHRPV